jgi:hypothetical protein
LAGYVAFEEIAPKYQLLDPMLVFAADFEASENAVSGELATYSSANIHASAPKPYIYAVAADA